MIKAVVGANWGDEGKGKITDMLAREADIIVRFQGGANAGHTIVNDYGKFALHTLPSGVFYGHTTSVIGNGVALNIPVFFKEYQDIIDRGVPAPKIMISDRAQIVMPYHILFDQYEEERLGGKSFGSTKSGIAPFYSDKYAKIGFQVNELFFEDELREKVERVCETKNVLLEHLYHKPLLNPDEIMAELKKYREMVEPYVGDVSLFLWNALKEGKEILLEGQLGSLKDRITESIPWLPLPPHWLPTALSEQAFRPMTSRRSSPSAKRTPARWAQALSYLRFLARKRTSSAEEAETAASTERLQDAPDVWDGLTVLLPNTAAVCREPQTLPLPFWMFWDILTRSRYAPDMRSTEK